MNDGKPSCPDMFFRRRREFHCGQMCSAKLCGRIWDDHPRQPYACPESPDGKAGRKMHGTKILEEGRPARTSCQFRAATKLRSGPCARLCPAMDNAPRVFPDVEPSLSRQPLPLPAAACYNKTTDCQYSPPHEFQTVNVPEDAGDCAPSTNPYARLCVARGKRGSLRAWFARQNGRCISINRGVECWPPVSFSRLCGFSKRPAVLFRPSHMTGRLPYTPNAAPADGAGLIRAAASSTRIMALGDGGARRFWRDK